MALGMEVGLPKKGSEPHPNFRPMSIVAKRLDGSKRHLARRWALFHAKLCSMGTQLPSPKKAAEPPPQFLAHFYCAQTVGCIKMPLSMEVSLSPGDFVLDGDQPPPQKGGRAPPISDPCLLWPNGWLDKDATWYGSRPRPRPHCIRQGPSSPAKGAQQPLSLFGPCLLWSRSAISATAELL